MKKLLKNIVALSLAIVMIIGIAPLSGFVGLELPKWIDYAFLRAEASSTVSIISPSDGQWISSKSPGQAKWTNSDSSASIACYRYTIVKLDSSNNQIEDLVRNQIVYNTVINLYEFNFEPACRYKLWVGGYSDADGKNIVDAGTSIVFYTTPEIPEVTTSSATNVKGTSATLNGTIVLNNGEDITECGFVYSTSSSNLTVTSSSSTKVKVSATGELSNYNFSKNISGLELNTKYYFKAYATNSEGTAYGSRMYFTTTNDYTEKPGSFSINSPVQNEELGLGNITVSWSSAFGAKGYMIALLDTTDNTKILNNVDIGLVQSYTISKSLLTEGNSYSLAVCAYNNYGNTWFEGRYFSVIKSTSNAAVLSVSTLPQTAPAGTEFTFTVTANNDTSKVGVEIDGNSIGTSTSYKTSGANRIFTLSHVVTSPGENRSVVAYPYDSNEKLTTGTATTKITVYDAPPAGVPIILSPAQNTTFSFGSLAIVRWNAPSTNPDYYNVYLYYKGELIDSIKTENTSYEIPVSLISDAGGYSVDVYAVKSGYKADTPANVKFFFVEAVKPLVNSVKIDNSTMDVNTKATFTVVTSNNADIIYMYNEDNGQFVESWSGSQYYVESGSVRTWTVTKTIHTPGDRALRFYSGANGAIHMGSSRLVWFTVEANDNFVATATVTSDKDVTIRQDESYTLNWVSDVVVDSYSIIVYKNGNQIYSLKNIEGNSHTIDAAVFADVGTYSVEVYPVLPCYDSVCDSATVTVVASEISYAEIISVDTTDQVTKDTDSFICNVVTNAFVEKVVLKYETGGLLEVPYKYTTENGNKIWQLVKTLDTIGIRQMEVIAYDYDGTYSAPYPFTVEVKPEQIDWNINYEPSTGNLTVSTDDPNVSDKLYGAYAKIVVYSNGETVDLVPGFNSNSIINLNDSFSRTWNVFSDLGLASGQTYTVAIAYISTLVNHYGGQDRFVMHPERTLLSPNYIDIPEVYSVDISSDEELSTMAVTNEVQVKLGKSAKITVVTSNNVTSLKWKPSGSSVDYSEIGQLVDKTTSGNETTWVFEKVFSSLHAARLFSVKGYSNTGASSAAAESSQIVSVWFPEYCNWSGHFDEGFLTITELNSYVYPDINTSDNVPNDTLFNNNYYLWIRESGKTTFTYYHSFSESESRLLRLTHQNLSGIVSHTFDLSSFNKLENGKTYEYGIGGVASYGSNYQTPTTDRPKIGEFKFEGTSTKTVQRQTRYATQLYNSEYSGNKSDIILPKGTVVTINASYENYTTNKRWVQIVDYAGATSSGPWYTYAEALIDVEDSQIKDAIQKELIYNLYGGNKGRISCDFDSYIELKRDYGYRHEGIDFAKSKNSEIYALNGGIVTQRGGDLNTVCIYDEENDKTVVYMHLNKISDSIIVGKLVNVGQCIGYEGEKGSPGSIHTHVEVVNGKRKKAKVSKDRTLENDNPYPYWNKILLKNNALNTNSQALSFDRMNSSDLYKIKCFFGDGQSKYINWGEEQTIIPNSTKNIIIEPTNVNLQEEYIIAVNGQQCQFNELINITDNKTEITICSTIDGLDYSDYTFIDLVKTKTDDNATIKEISLLDYKRASEQNVLIYTVDVDITPMNVTIPRSVTQINFSTKSESEFAHVQVYRDGIPIIDPSDMLISETESTDIRIVVTADSGDQKEYSLTINKKQEYESDTALSALHVSYNDENGYVDTLEFLPENKTVVLPETATSIDIFAAAVSEFASAQIYVDGVLHSGEEPVPVVNGQKIKAIVTAENGDKEEYEFTVSIGTASIETYTVTLDPNGGEVESETLIASIGSQVTLPSVDKYWLEISYSVKSGVRPYPIDFADAVCLGWSEDENSSTAEYDIGGSYAFNKDTTLHAIWETQTATVSSRVPERSGYIFLGWTTDPNSSVPEYAPGSTIEINKDITLYDVWEVDTSTAEIGVYLSSDSLEMVFDDPDGVFGPNVDIVTVPENQEVTITSNDESIARASKTVTSSGKTSFYILSMKPGETTVTVSMEYEGQTYTSEYNVVIKEPEQKYLACFRIDGFVYADAWYSEGDNIVLPPIPEKNGYEFAGWTPAVPDTMPAYDLFFDAVFNEHDLKDVHLSITPPVTRTVNYGESIKLYANATNLPEGAKIRWNVEGSGVLIKASSSGKVCTVTSTSTGNVVIKAYLVNSEGNIIKDKNGKQISDSEYLYSDANLWLRIVHFFKKLFGIN